MDENTTTDLAIDSNTKAIVQKIPLCSVRAGPGDDKDEWAARLRQELTALISYVKTNKANDSDWFYLDSNANGTKWSGSCWYVYNHATYRFKLEFEIPVTYPVTPFEIILPELDGKTSKMYRGGKICLSLHFKPLWARNAPRFGVAHALALGLAPWLAAEVPYLVDTGVLSTEGTATAAAGATVASDSTDAV